MDAASILEPDPGFWTKTSWIQLGYGVWLSLTVLGVGMLFEFPAVTIPQLAKPGSVISVSISDESWIGFIYLYFYIPETKDLTLQEIDEYFEKRRPTLVSERQVISAQIRESKSMSAGFSEKSNLNMKAEKKNTRNSHNDNIQRRMSQHGEDDEPSTTTALNLSTDFKPDSETRDTDQSGSISRDKVKQ